MIDPLQQGNPGVVELQEPSLREAAEHFQLLAEISPDGLTIIENNRVSFSNDRICEITGYSREELSTLSTLDLATPDEKKRLEKFVESTDRICIGPEQLEFWIVRKDGQHRYIRNRYSRARKRGNFTSCFILTTDLTERKRAEKALIESELRYRTLFESANDAIFLMDGERFIDCNEKTLQIFGCTREQIIGSPPYRYSPRRQPDGRDSLDKAREKIGSALNGKPQFFEWLHCQHDGTPFDAEVSLSRFGLGGKVYLLAIVRDITQRKRVESELKVKEAAIASSIDAISISDLDGIVTYANNAFLKMFGYSREDEVIGRPAAMFAASASDVEAWFMRTVKDGSWQGELSCRRSDGSILQAMGSASLVRDERSNPQCLIGFFVDISDRIRAEEELKKSEKRFKDLAELLPACVCELDTEAKFTYVNRQSYEFSGYSQADVDQGLSALELVVPEDRERLARNFKRSLLGQKSGGSEYRARKRDGSIADVIIYSNPIKQDGKPVGLRGIVVDITDKKRLEEFATRAQRLETAGRIAGQVAHDFNNLLGPLMAYPELIAAQLPEDHQCRPYLHDMERAAAKISEINQQLLTLGRRGHYNQSPLNLNEVVSQALRQIKKKPESLTIVVEADDNLMNIVGGEGQLFRVISNLVSNARDAMQDHGRLTIRTENVYIDRPRGHLEKIPKGEYVRLTVADTGDGIPPAILPVIFDPFFTTKRADRKRGSGLGLSIVHAVMEDHNGHVDCETALGEGTSFHLYFPVSRESVEMSSQKAVVGGSESVLVVDDDRVQREVTRNLLDSLGYRVALAESGEQALDLMRQETFDLLILDMIMPDGIDGAETYRLSRELCPGQKAVVVSGYAESERVEFARQLGAEIFVRKPLTLKSIAAAVRGELDRKSGT